MLLNPVYSTSSGLILLIPPSMRFAKSNNGPFISIYVDAKGFLFTHCRVGHPMEDGQDVLAPNSRARLVTFRYSVPAQRNQWHTLIVEKRTRALIVQLDNGPKERVRTVSKKKREHKKALFFENRAIRVMPCQMCRVDKYLSFFRLDV
ncbi:hypothetical protein FGIG_12654 [Fasciola gigantica]|uniref:Uncharacterized protein n=1 Tax=Fasciola gigantica TaxID=46835 RepID=A0A504Y8W5_FASGI|nr:hypothetical protein FGIG_12654 [Fasciola gigantica]